MKVIYCSNDKFGSWLIRTFTWSRFSHVVFVEDDTHVIDSTFTHGGVQRRPMADIYRDYTTVEVVEIPVPDEQAALAFARSQLGKPYDKTAIIGFIFRRRWADADSWFCNELIEAIATAGGRQRFRESISRITPQESWSVI